MKPHRYSYILHILSWAGLYVFWIMVFQKRSFTFSRTATIELCYLIFIAANFYFNVYYAIPKSLYKQNYLAYAVLFTSAILLTAMLRVPLALQLNAHYFLVGKPQPTPQALFIASFVNIFIWTTGIVAAKIVADRLRFQQHLEAIEKERSKAELDFLNAQLNPHFLFNSIHSIYAHIDKQNASARNMLLSFSDMLRYQLYDCSNNAIPVEKELNYVKNYVALQRVRKEEDLVVKLDIDKNLTGLTVAPLLFVCFVENAFKFVGSSEAGESLVHISFFRRGNSLLFKCVNTKERIPHHRIEHRGIGIPNAKRRLELLYPGKYSMDIQDSRTYYAVELLIELNEMEMHHSG